MLEFEYLSNPRYLLCRYLGAQIRVPNCPMSAQILAGVLKYISSFMLATFGGIDPSGFRDPHRPRAGVITSGVINLQ